ncbi:hypothetical protein EVAR_81633_1 [Eumeta japonica]|uniref:Uncharacterized protein n=1 Tax=Eumeta variegata TaxID=151549 RepID=A0A4C1WF02_EUMVA|nr:hypothetical protein EVAR_81633_1 [Eumeta japonica]
MIFMPEVRYKGIHLSNDLEQCGSGSAGHWPKTFAQSGQFTRRKALLSLRGGGRAAETDDDVTIDPPGEYQQLVRQQKTEVTHHAGRCDGGGT